MLKVLVTGAEGQVGRALVAAFDGHDVVAAGHRHLDVSDRDAVLAAVLTLRPDAVVHAAAWTDVDRCELDPDGALKVNALGTRNVAEATRRAAAHLCYLSTDYVFSGDVRRPYNEWDEPAPLSVYGRSKLGGERECPPGSTVVRTSWVSGRHGRNFVRSMLEAASRGGELHVVDDQHGCATIAEDLAATVARLVVARLPGTFHVTNQGQTTRYEMARAALSFAGLDPGRVVPVATSELQPPRPAPRPPWSVLDNAALRLSGVPLLPHYTESLERLVGDLVP